MTPCIRATHRRACHLGWVPPPTNDVQRAIWEKIKADKERGPTNPITIPPPNAKKEFVRFPRPCAVRGRRSRPRRRRGLYFLHFDVAENDVPVRM